MKNTLVFLTAISLSLTANAGMVNGITPINIMYDAKTPMATFAPSGTTAVSGCAANDFYAIPSTVDVKTLVSMLMSAKAMGKTVSVLVPDDSTKCNAQSGRPSVIAIQIDG